jgi:Flp pilus assembly pilin Flp
MFATFLRPATRLLSRLRRERKGAALVEYALLVAGVALIGLVAVALLGHKTNELIGAAAVTLPGAETAENGPITAGKLVETKQDASTGAITLDVDKVRAGGERLGNNTGIDAERLFIEPGEPQ